MQSTRVRWTAGSLPAGAYVLALATALILALSIAQIGCGKKPPEPTLAVADAAGTDPGPADAAPDALAAPFAKSNGPNNRPKANLTIENGVVALRPKLYACWKKTSETNPKEAGSTRLELSIAADGSVRDAKPSPSDLSNATLDCLRDTARAFKFDPPGHDSTTVLPLTYPTPGHHDGGAP